MGLYASLVNINAYHQPGVEAGKKAAGVVIALQKAAVELLAGAGAPLTAGEVAARLGSPDEAEALFAILRHLAANPGSGIGITAQGSPADWTFTRK